MFGDPGEEQSTRALPVSARNGEPTEQSTRSKTLGSSRVHPARIERSHWDGSLDVSRHKWYDPVLTQLLPGERLIFMGGHKQSDVW